MRDNGSMIDASAAHIADLNIAAGLPTELLEHVGVCVRFVARLRDSISTLGVGIRVLPHVA